MPFLNFSLFELFECVKSEHIKQEKNERSFDGHACVVTDL
jgi:hypothetical protein